MQARRLLVPLFAVAVFSTSCAGLTGPDAAGPLPPPVDDTINTEAAFPDDGLARLIVTPIAGAPEAQTAGDPNDPASSTSDPVTTGDGPIPTTGADPVPMDPSRLLTPGMVAAMPPGAVLEARDGKVGYIDTDGEFVEFDQSLQPVPAAPSPDAEPVVEIEALYGNPYIDQLAANSAVENVIVVGDGTFGIETSDPSVIDSSKFSVVEDVPFAVTEDPYERYQWHLENDGTNLNSVTSIAQVDDADLDIAPTLGRADGRGVVVAVIDTGVDFSNPDLENSSWSNLGEVCGNGVDDDANGFVDDCIGWDFAHNDAQPYNQGGNAHGTHVAGIITANRDGRGVVGVAPDARIMDLNVAYANGSMSGAAITAAIRYAVDNGADIINMSLGTNPGASASGMGGMLSAIDYAAANDVLVVVAAGNSNVDLGSLAVYPASFDRPNMIVVGASAPDDSRASFSNYNANIVDLYAPGVHILSTMPGDNYQFMSGTSQASPATAALAALVMETTPGANVAQVIDQVVSTVDSVDALSTSAARGRANAASALGVGDAPPLPTEVDVSVAGLVGADNDVSARVVITTPAEAFDEDHRWELSLITSTNEGAYAVVEHPFVLDGLETATGLTGAVVLGSSATEAVEVSTQLPDGQYSFVIEAVPTADGASRLGDAFVTTFQVGEGVVSIDNGSSSPTTAPGSSAPTTSAPTNGSPTTVPGAGNSPTTVPPSDGNNGGGGSGTPTTTNQGGSPSTSTGPVAEPGTPVTTAPITTAPITVAPPVPTTAAPGTPSTTAPAGGGNDGGGNDGGSGGRDGGSGGGGTPSPTTPPPTMPNAPAPVPPNVGDDSATDGEWSISSISPQAGYVDNANSVTIRGTFPATSYVWFGEQPGQVVHQTDDLIVVRTPLRSTSGVVDVSLRITGAGTVLSVPNAYAYVPWGDEVPADGGNTGGDTGSGNTGGGDTDGSNTDGTTGGGNNGGDTGGDGGSDNTGDDGAGDEQTNRRPRMVVGSAVELGSGLMGAAISPNPAANTPVCSTDPCTAVRR